jgi:hypothetical protein
MGIGYQPESLSFDIKGNNFGPHLGTDGRCQHMEQQDGYDAESVQGYSFPAHRSSSDGIQSSPMVAKPQQQGQYGITSRSHVFNDPLIYPHTFIPPSSQQANNCSRDFYPQQQQQFSLEHVAQPIRTQAQHPRSGDTSRTNTWIRTPACPYTYDEAYLHGAVSTIGCLADTKNKQSEVHNPFDDLDTQSPSLRQQYRR